MKRCLSVVLAILLAIFIVSCAEPEAPKFTVSFEGVEEKIDPVIVKAGEKFKLPDNLPTKDRHTLVIKMGETVLEAGKEYDIKADTVLKCSWEKFKWTLTIDGKSTVVEDGHVYKLDKTKKGFRLDSIKVDGQVATDKTSITIDKNTDVEYKWIATGTITFKGLDKLDKVYVKDVGTTFEIPMDIAVIPANHGLVMLKGEERVFRGEKLAVNGDITINCSIPEETPGLTKEGTTVTGYTGTSKTVVIPEGITVIGERALMNKGIEAVYLPESLLEVQARGIFFNSITSIAIPPKTTRLGDFALCNNAKLTSVKLSGGVEELGMCCFNTCSYTTIVLPSTLKKIGDQCFGNCNNLSEMTIPASVSDITGTCFNGFNSMKSIKVLKNKEDCTGFVTGWNSDIAVEYLNGSEPNKRCKITCVGNVDVPCGYIEKGEGYSFESFVTSPDKYSLICTVNGKREIESYITINEDSLIDYQLLKGTDILECQKTEIDVNVLRIKENNKDYSGTVVIPEKYEDLSVTEIGEAAFKDAGNIETVILPDSMETIGASAFQGCSKLKTIYIHKRISTMGANAFMGCENLKEITVDKNKSECSEWPATWHGATATKPVTVHYKDETVTYPETK